MVSGVTAGLIGLKAVFYTLMNETHHMDAWDRWLMLWHGLFVLVWVGVTVAAMANPSTIGRLRVLMLAGVLLAWYVGYARLYHWHGPDLYRLLYYGIGVGLWFYLTGFTNDYMFLLFALYPSTFTLMPMFWASLGTLWLTLLLLLRLSVIQSALDVWLVPIILGTLGGTALGWFINAIIRQSQERRDLIRELKAARRDLAAAERQAGILEERGRLAREIHDTLAQGFIGVIAHLAAAGAAPTTELSRHIAQAEALARDSLAEARRFVWDLRPASLDDADDLAEALRALAARYAIDGPAVTVQVKGTADVLPEHCASALVRVAGEALSNAARHAAATTITLTVDYTADAVRLTVADNGCGFDPSQLSGPSLEGGHGLVSMRERLAAIGGTLILESSPGAGTTITANVPSIAESNR